MNIAPILDASLAVQIHVASVLPAALIGPYMFWARKGTPSHRLLGRVWIGLMVVASISSFFIHSINLFLGFSPIHLLSIFVLYSSWQAVRAARMHRIAAHRINVISMYVGGIIVAGGFTLLPGRLMHDVIFTYPEGWPTTAKLATFFGIMVSICLGLGFLAQAAKTLGAQAKRKKELSSTR